MVRLHRSPLPNNTIVNTVLRTILGTILRTTINNNINSVDSVNIIFSGNSVQRSWPVARAKNVFEAGSGDIDVDVDVDVDIHLLPRVRSSENS